MTIWRHGDQKRVGRGPFPSAVRWAATNALPTRLRLMAAIIYFGEMLIAPLLAIVLLAISSLEVTSAGTPAR